jgi:hypothetical protein
MASSHVFPASPTVFASANAPRSFRLGAADGIILGLAAMKLLFHLLMANRYGIFRDEMYGLACAEHLDWGYVDHPPGGILIAWLARHLFGDSLLGLRFLPALAGATLVWLTGIVTREIGGRAFAQALAALAVCVVPVYAIMDHWLTMNAFEPLVWLGCQWCVLRAIHTGEGRYWIWFGLLAGIGVELKYSIVFLVAGVLAGLMLTPERRQAKRASLWIGLLLGAALALPNFIWQARHGFPFLELMHHVRESQRDVVRGPVAFMVDQALIMQPLLAPLWIGGVAWLLLGREQKRYGAFGWAFLVVVGAFVAMHGKNYYVTPIYPIAFAAGAVAFERVSASRAGAWARVGYLTAVTVGGGALLPLAAPILAPETFLHYEAWLGMTPPAFEHQNDGPLPQYFADEFGWEEMVCEVARVYHALPPAEQARTAIFSKDWGEAAAVDYFGHKYGLPRAISIHNSYWLWGPRDYTGEIVIVLHSDGTGDRRHFTTVEKAGHVEHPYSRRDEWFDIYLCRGLKFNLHETWPKMKLFD